FTDNTPQRFEAYGWHVIPAVDGHNPEAVKAAVEAARAETGKPTLICCKTIIGFGAPNKQGSHDSHGSPLGADEIALVRTGLGWTSEAFVIPDDVYAGWDAKANGQIAEKAWLDKLAAYKAAYPELAVEFDRRVIRDELPADFAKIPEGSPKDHVLASVAGTDAANDAVQEAAVPQTAKVDRNSAQAEVAYDGDPQFEDIDGTDLDYAVNTPASVIRWKGRYYSVDNGVWFESGRATGPWVVSVRRPYAVALIPPSYPVYHMKYVYIYDVTPEYVYMGYTPGYLNTFVYGPTVVYGTGFYYRPWFGTHYYARPYTWGFNVRYNPWIGWGIGYHYSSGWFNMSVGIGRPWGYWGGGWWGPRSYRPSYCWGPSRYGGSYYGRNNFYYNRGRNYNYATRNYSGNIYRNRSGVLSRDYNRIVYNNRNRSVRNGDWSSNNRSNVNGRYNNGNNYNNRNNGNYNNRNSNNRFNGRENNNDRENVRDNNRNNNNRDNIGNRPSERSDRPVREYNPTRRTDPYGRNNNINPGNVNPGSNRDNNDNRERRNPANSNPANGNGNRNNGNITPRSGNDNQTEMPGRISRPERSERLNS
ncbi:MAG: hypothetical protein EOP51_27675, partial [Sphingobacteriales bacterium]